MTNLKGKAMQHTTPAYTLAYQAVIVAAMMWTATAALGDSTYYVTPVGELTLTEGEMPMPTGQNTWRYWRQAQNMPPYVVVDTPAADAFIEATTSWSGGVPDYQTLRVAVQADAGGDVNGRLYLPNQDWTGMVQLRFTITADGADPAKHGEFLEVKLSHYQRLLSMDVPGAAWFRYQANRVAAELKAVDADARPNTDNRAPRRNNGRDDMQEAYHLLSGGLALSENLQLDRVLIQGADGEQEMVELDSIEGITIREFDWAPLNAGLTAPAEALAALIPADQHALLFGSFQGLLDLMDYAQDQGTPVLYSVEPRAQDARTRQRYERQLGLKPTALSRMMGPAVIKSVAATGSDPYLRVGADVAILFEPVDAASLRTIIETQVMLQGQAQPDAKQVSGEVGGVAYSGIRSPGREVCSYVAMVGGAVVVTNSLAQLEKLVAVAAGGAQALSSLPEYTYFRDRYPRDNAGQTALLIIPDHAIRRWCGPRWRIGNARRTAAGALLADLHAEHLDALATGAAEQATLETKRAVQGGGELTLTRTEVCDSVYGSIGFQTPIVELEMDRVTKSEADLYGRWRAGYQGNWSNFFDPIAISLYAGDDGLRADMTVMPLIDNSEYRQLIEISQGAEIGPESCDPHPETLLQVVLAVNRASRLLQQQTGMARSMMPQLSMDPLSWLGDAISVYADEDPFWQELTEAEEMDDFAEANFYRLPVALHFEVDSGLKLTAFLTAIRAFVEQSSPGMTAWETLEHNGKPYVKVSPTAAGAGSSRELENLAVYYAASGEALVITLNHELLKRSLDRRGVDPAAIDAGRAEAGRVAEAPAWLGKNLSVYLRRASLEIIEAAFGDNIQNRSKALAWNNLYVLNEWKRHDPNGDPVALHQAVWGRRLVCPGGGEYRWNNTWQTMESTVYGHPGEPGDISMVDQLFAGVRAASMGLTFEEHGLRAGVVIERAAPAATE